MSLKNLIDDAIVLKDLGRNLSALTLLCVGIAATSRKLFPKGSNSIEKPTKKNGGDNKMRDDEAFRLFFNSRILEVLFSHDRDRPEYVSKINLTVGGEELSLSEILYKNYRCELVHEAELNESGLFVPDMDTLTYNFGGAGIGIVDGSLVITHSWCKLLYEMVRGATVNGEEFGEEYYVYRVSDGVNELEHQSNVMAEYDSYSSPEIVLSSFYDLIPLVKSSENKDIFNEQIKRCLDEEVCSIYGGYITLRRFGLTDDRNELNAQGLVFLKEYFSVYNSVRL